MPTRLTITSDDQEWIAEVAGERVTFAGEESAVRVVAAGDGRWRVVEPEGEIPGLALRHAEPDARGRGEGVGLDVVDRKLERAEPEDADQIAVTPDQLGGRLDIKISYVVRGANSRFNASACRRASTRSSRESACVARVSR